MILRLREEKVRSNLAASLAPGESRNFTIDGSRAIRRLSMRIDADDRRQALRSTVLSIAFDGELTVWAPVGEFFWVGYYPVATGTWYTRAVQDDVMSAWWGDAFRAELYDYLDQLWGTAGGDIQGCCS